MKNFPPRGIDVLRLDRAHRGANFNHVNINSKVSGIPDPHLRLPKGGLTAGKGIAKAAKVANKVLLPIALVVDGCHIGYAAYKDTCNGSSRNTVETVASVAGGWGGGFGGAVGGAAIGSAIFPGVGTLVGGIVGGLLGGVGTSVGASMAVDYIADECGYDIIDRDCKGCGQKFTIRKYCGEKDSNLCPCCRDQSDSTCEIQTE